MTDHATKKKPKADPPRWRVFVLFGILLVLIVIGLRWGVMHYMVSAGQMALKQRNLDAAETWFQRANLWGDGGGSLAFYRARLARVKGDLENAQLLLEVAARQGYSREAIDRERAMNIAQAGEPTPLMRDLHRIMADDSVDPGEVMCSTISGLERNGQLGEAFQMLDFWMAADLEDARMHYHRGRLHKLLNEWEPAEKSLSRAVQLAPYWQSARVQFGEVLLASNKLDEAMQQFNLALAASPEDFNALLGRVAVLIKQNKVDEALSALEQRKEASEKDYRYHVLLAEAAQAKGDHERAVDSLLQLIPDYENDLSLNQLLLASYRALGKEDEVKRVEEKIAQGESALVKQKEFLAEIDKERGSDYDWLMMCTESVAPYKLEAGLPFFSKASHLRMDAAEPQQWLVKYYEQSGDAVMADSVRRTLRKINMLARSRAKQAVIDAERQKEQQTTKEEQQTELGLTPQENPPRP